MVAGLGMGLTAGALLAAPQADAASEMAQLAANDGRLGILALLFVPVVGWVRHCSHRRLPWCSVSCSRYT